MAYQLDRPSDGTGIVVAFRRKESPDSTYTVQLRGLDSDASYWLRYDPDVAAPGREQIRLGHKPDPALLIDDTGRQTNPDRGVTQPQRSEDGRSRVGVGLPAGEVFEMRGRDLAEGLTLTLSNPRSSLLLRYEKRSD